MTTLLTRHVLPASAPARVLALGGRRRNTACLVGGDAVHFSPMNGDLDAPDARLALEASVDALLRGTGGRVDAIAHDLHPDFENTPLAIALADTLGVPAIGVQHHHARIGAVQAERGRIEPMVGLALDGRGYGSDGTAWGGELLLVAGAHWERAGHLSPLRLPGGELAAREPWRMAAAALHALGRDDEIVPRLAPAVGDPLAESVATMLARSFDCPPTTSAGRWFDAMAGLLGLSIRQADEAEAATALERMAVQWLATHAPEAGDVHGLDLLPLLSHCLEIAARSPASAPAAAARFHAGLADGIAEQAIALARDTGACEVVLAGGCFRNELLARRTRHRLERVGLGVTMPGFAVPGDAGLALGQAWIAAHAFAEGLIEVSPERAFEPARREVDAGEIVTRLEIVQAIEVARGDAASEDPPLPLH